jgi:hypothetical protein
MFRIPQNPVGLANVTGECHCFGLSVVGEATPVYIDLAGPATAVEAAWARLAQGKELAIVRYGGQRSLYVQPSREGTLARFQRRIPELRVDHLVLVSRALTQPVYHERSETYVIRVTDKQARAKIGAHVSALVRVAVFEQWHAYLEQRGRDDGLIQPCECYGGIDMHALDLDRDAWTRIICAGLEAGEISLPNG